MAHFFISYSREDIKFADLLQARLHNAGFETWRDKTNLKIGSRWSQEIDDGIARAVGVIVVVTPDSLKSSWVTYEWVFASAMGVRVIPLIFIDMEISEIHDKLRQFNIEKFVDPDEAKWTQLIQTLREAYAEYPVYVVGQLFKTTRQRPDRTTLDQITRTLFSMGSLIIPTLIEALHDRDHSVRGQAATVLGQMHSIDAVPALIESLRDKAPPVRAQAATALKEIGDKSAATELINCLYDISPVVRTSAAMALEVLAPPEAVEELIYVLKDEEASARQFAASALGEIGDARAVEPLIELLNDEALGYGSDPVCVHAAESLIQIRNPEGLKAVREWREKRVQSQKK